MRGLKMYKVGKKLGRRISINNINSTNNPHHNSFTQNHSFNMQFTNFLAAALIAFRSVQSVQHSNVK